MQCVNISEASISWWIDWLTEEHVLEEYEFVKPKVCSFMKKNFAPAELWDFFNPETIQALWEIRQGDLKAWNALDKTRGKSKVIR